MSDDVTTYFGIDLGTTYSAISYLDDTGRPSVIRNTVTNDETMPSVVYFENATNVVVGSTAKEVARLYPNRVVALVKRAMGQEREWIFDNTTYTPESISALILKQLAQDAEQATGERVEKVVITVPAYFGMLERDATRNAGRIAGLDVVGIVPEPVAAALQYDVVSDAVGKTILVYDLGGGTFDTTVIQIKADSIEVVCTDGDQELGGTDWDDRLMEYLLDEFRSQANPAEDPADDEQFMQDLALVAEQTKRRLSQVTSSKVPLRFAGASAMVEVTRAAFEEQTRDQLERTIEYTKRTLQTFAKKQALTGPPEDSIDEVLLVGGSTKMPAVAGRLSSEFGWSPRLADPDLAVAKGAARYALARAVWRDSTDENESAASPAEQEQRIREVSQQTSIPAAAIRQMAEKRVVTVLPKAFGVKLLKEDASDVFNPDPVTDYRIAHMVHANDPLPVEKVELEAATSADNQTMVRLQIYEQAGSVETSDVTGNKPVDQGAGEITFPPVRANSPIDIMMKVDVEGLLTVHAVERTSQHDCMVTVRVSVLSEEAVQQAAQMVSALTVKS